VKWNKVLLAAAFAIALVLVTLAVAVFERRRIQNIKAAETRRRVQDLADGQRQRGNHGPTALTCFVGPMMPDNNNDPYVHVVDPCTVDPTPRILTLKEQDLEPFSRDAWGQPIRFRQPGPVHRNGWDIWSVGPNGIDEEGEGDDILVGEDDVAMVSSRSIKR
jgi:hypothetical protein